MLPHGPILLQGALDIPYEDDILHCRKGWERTELVLDAKTAWQPVTSGLRDWRSHIPAGVSSALKQRSVAFSANSNTLEPSHFHVA